MKISIKMAFCGIIASLSTVLMFLTGLVPVATLAIPAIAGCLLISVVAEVGTAWGFGVYGVCGVLAFLLTPDREAFLFYVLFFGYYPVLFAPLGKIRNRVGRIAAKLLVFNAAVLAEMLIAIYLLGIPMESISFLGKFTPVVMLVLLNVVFLIYDRALDGLIALYFHKIHGRVRMIFKMK